MRGLAALLPAALCALALASVSLLPETARPAVVAAGVLLTLLAVRWGVLRATPPGVAATVPALLLLGYLLAGDAVLGEALRQPAATPQPGTGELAAVSGLTLALAAAPAAWLVRRFGDRAGNRLARSRSLTEFTGVVRPLLATTGALMLSALLAAYALAWTVVHAPHPPPPDVAALATTVATGLLLATAMLLIAYERRTAAAAGLAAAGLTLALLLALACASWLPPLRPLGAPLEQLVRSAGGPATLSAVVCSLAAAALLITAAQVLSSPWPHYALPAPRPSGGPPRRVRPAAAPATPGGTVRHPCPQPAAGPSGGRD